MTTPYSQLTEQEKENRRKAVRKYAAKTDRKNYYREYEKIRIKSKEEIMLYNSQGNARRKNLEHTIVKEDIEIPEVCPCCTKPIERPSLDRVDNSKGYIKSNIKVICTNCNAELHRKIADYMEKHI